MQKANRFAEEILSKMMIFVRFLGQMKLKNGNFDLSQTHQILLTQLENEKHATIRVQFLHQVGEVKASLA